MRAKSETRRVDPREVDQFYSRSPYGLRDVVRVAAALGGVAFYAAVLAVVAH